MVKCQGLEGGHVTRDVFLCFATYSSSLAFKKLKEQFAATACVYCRTTLPPSAARERLATVCLIK